MKITNKFNLPEVVVQAMKNDPYYKGDGVDYSASELIAPVQQVVLKHRHWENLEEDAVEGTWKLLGKSVHYILEKAGLKNSLTEERICMSLLGKKISGQFDFYTADGILYDLKVTSVWGAIYGSRKEDWTKQLNIYRFLLHTCHFEVKKIRVLCVYRDWSPREQAHDKSGKYPKNAIEEVELPLWTLEDTEAFIKAKLTALMIAENDPDDDLQSCTAEERWEKPTTWAVMKTGNKTAMRVFGTDTNPGTEVDAENYIEANNLGGKAIVQMRPGESTRCLNYCAVKNFCRQYLKMTEGEENGN